MKIDMKNKIAELIKLKNAIDEHQTRSLMILLRKNFELISEDNKKNFSILNLFCNWSAHTKIDQSITGLKIIARVNDAFVKIKDSQNISEIQLEITNAVGFTELRSEFEAFLAYIGVEEIIEDDQWLVILNNLIDIIKDVPLTFPELSKFKPAVQKIYERIAKNPIKPGSGVIMIILSIIDYEKLGIHNMGEVVCLLIRTEDSTTTVVPLAVPL